MQYFYIEPEVAGSLGDHTIMDRSIHPPVIDQLHYQMEGWLGDVILESFPAFIITEEAMQRLLQIGVTGVEFSNVEITTTDQFKEIYPDRKLPKFTWLKPSGKVDQDDFAISVDGRLVVSERVLNLLQILGISNASVELFDN